VKSQQGNFTIRVRVHTLSLAAFKAVRFAILTVLMVWDVRGGVVVVGRKKICGASVVVL
jgi:hypothetical protein